MTCECQDSRSKNPKPCKRCLFLDGASPGAGRVISELRALGGTATWEALAVELGIGRTGVIKAIKPLVETGRVRRRIMDAAFGDGSVKQRVTLYELRGAA